MMVQKNELQGKVAIVTGASSGIGAATARRLAREGLRVTLAARRRERLERLAEEIVAGDGEALVLPTDVRDSSAIDHMVQATLDRWGRIDVLINNAGLGHDTYLTGFEPDLLHEEVQVNLVAVMECARSVLPAMFERSSGHIINVASIAGLVGLPGATVYSATKFGVVGFSDGLRREVGRRGIHVTAFCPGFVATDFSPDLQAIAEGRRPRHPRPGAMRVDYVAGYVAWLVRHPRRRAIIPPGWGLLVAIAQAYPWLTDFILARVR